MALEDIGSVGTEIGVSLPSKADVAALTSTIFTYAIYMLVFALVAFVIYKYIKNVITYKFPIVINARRGNARKVRYGKGGYIKKKGLRTFRLRWGKLIKWGKNLDFLPDTSLMDSDGRLYFDQLDPDTYAQVRIIHNPVQTKLRLIKFLKTFENNNVGDIKMQYEHIAEPMISEGIAEYVEGFAGQPMEVEDIYSEPVPRDQKQLAIQEIKMVDQALKDDTMKKWLIGGSIIGILIIAFFGIYFLTSG
jgi:hypothetical protein